MICQRQFGLVISVDHNRVEVVDKLGRLWVCDRYLPLEVGSEVSIEPNRLPWRRIMYDPRQCVLRVYWAGYKNPCRCEAMDALGVMWVCEANRDVAIGDILISDAPPTKFPPATLYVRECHAMEGTNASNLRDRYFSQKENDQ